MSAVAAVAEGVYGSIPSAMAPLKGAKRGATLVGCPGCKSVGRKRMF